MLSPDQPLAIYLEGALGEMIGKMGYGVLRYSPNRIACIIDSTKAGSDHEPLSHVDRPCPVVSTIEEAIELGAQVLVLGTAPPGGLIPAEWLPVIDDAVSHGMSVINGLHDLLASRFENLRSGQWIWDVRVEPPGLGVGTGKARFLGNRRVLMIGTDMAVGKMTAGLEIYREARNRGLESAFVATGQIGITIMGSGVPLDAVRLDYASGAIEREVMAAAEAELVIVEGQGALIHPGSTANLPLLRGACPTHLVLCHRAGQERLLRHADIGIPALRDYLALYEELATACGVFPRPRSTGIALNTGHLGAQEGGRACLRLENEYGLPCVDVIRDGAGRLLDAILA